MARHETKRPRRTARESNTWALKETETPMQQGVGAIGVTGLTVGREDLGHWRRRPDSRNDDDNVINPMAA